MGNLRMFAVVTFVLVAASACRTGSSGTVPLTSLQQDFESCAVGPVPAGFHVDETNGKGTPARWEVAEGGPGVGVRMLRIASVANRGETFNLLLSDDDFVADLRVGVSLRADSGEEDQGGGLLWRAQGPADYYTARWNPLEDNVRIYKVVRGERTMFKTAKVVVEPGTWHRLEVTMEGSKAEVRFDGRPMLEMEDATFTDAGRIGLWTKADAATSFDDLSVAPLRLPE